MPGINGFEMMARLGFGARALMYGAIGYLALRLGRTEDNQGALAYIESVGGGILLGIMAIGFLGYGVWRLSEALIDSEGQGTGAKGIAQRVGGGVSGIIHLFLCWAAIGLATGGKASSGDSAEQGASTALALPGGSWMLIVVAIVLLALAAFQIVKAYRLGFLKHLDPAVAGQAWIAWVGRAGYLARGIVFAMTALFMWEASQQERAAAAGGMEQALDRIPAEWQVFVAAGLFLFGVFSAVEARYRRITDPQVIDRLRARVAAG
jgi:hypothetical protein